MPQQTGFTWKFQRIGGLDQVSLRTSEELRHLNELDPKLWVALSCPASGLEFDARTLELIDGDKDGRIRVGEVKAAVAWICGVLKDPSVIVNPQENLPLEYINTDTPEGKRLSQTAEAVLSSLGKSGTRELSREDAAEAVVGAAKQTFNGDGILPPLAEFDEDIRGFIQDALHVVGGVTDASGQPGINRKIGEAFIETLRAWKDWKQSVSDASSPLGPMTDEAWDLLQKLKDKIEDYFLRCELASYLPETPIVGNDAEERRLYVPPEHGLLQKDSLEDLPLARIAPDRPLSVTSGLNPAWRERVERLFTLIKPLLSNPEQMSRDEWLRVKTAFGVYEKALAAKPPKPEVTVDVQPVSTPEQLGEERIAQLLGGGTLARFKELAEKDLSVPASSGDIGKVERLVLYYLHLHRLLMNFVSFYDFYSLRKHAAFQSGTLYIDGRSCSLCLPVQDIARHATLAAFSELCLIYCDCRRIKTEEGSGKGEEETMHIVAAMTAGNADLLLEGRNGVYVDNDGRSWDATLVRLVSNPISLREALWQPYRRLGRLITEQVARIAGNKDSQLADAMGKRMDSAAATIVSNPAPTAPPQNFDIGRSVGIFAAIGLAIGAIGTALASIARALFSLSWWQFPLIILGLFLLVSGPSVVLAWLKLRKRTLGPVLEASGWAVNGSVPVNLSLGTALTATASLPENASRSFSDPFRPPSRWPWFVLLGAIAIGALAVWLWLSTDIKEKIFSSSFFQSVEQAQPVGNSTNSSALPAAVPPGTGVLPNTSGERTATVPQTGNAGSAPANVGTNATRP